MRQLLTVCPFTCRLTLFQHSFSTVIVNGHNTQQPPQHYVGLTSGELRENGPPATSLHHPKHTSSLAQEPSLCPWMLLVDQACSGGLPYPFSGTTVAIDIQIPAVLGWHAKCELWVWPRLHIRRRDASRFQQACWVVRADAAASVATTIALIEKVNLTNQLKVVNIHWTKIMIIKYTFLAKCYQNTYSCPNYPKKWHYPLRVERVSAIFIRQTATWLPVWCYNGAGCC